MLNKSFYSFLSDISNVTKKFNIILPDSSKDPYILLRYFGLGKNRKAVGLTIHCYDLLDLETTIELWAMIEGKTPENIISISHLFIQKRDKIKEMNYKIGDYESSLGKLSYNSIYQLNNDRDKLTEIIQDFSSL